MTETPAPRVTVLISGKGSNLRALLEHQGDYKISHVISNRVDAGGLEHAREFGVPTTVVTRDSYESLSSFKAAVLEAVVASNPEFVALAGFMMVLQPEFIDRFEGRLVNIHPSLLPNFPGLDTHSRAIEAKLLSHGCSVHFVDAGVDTGALIAQASVPVEPSDSPETLAARVLTKEHVIYPLCLAALVRGDVSLSSHKVRYSDRFRSEASAMGFTIFE